MGERVARRRPWLAGLLQFVTPGLGNVYSGRPLRGVLLKLLAPFLGAGVLVVFLLTPQPLNLLVGFLGLVSLQAFIIVDGVRCARVASPDYRLARYNRWYFYVLMFVGATLFDAYVLSEPILEHVARAYNTPTVGMEPALLLGDHFIANKHAYLWADPKRGDIVVFRSSFGTLMTKRVVGLPDETIEIRDRIVFINGEKLEEPYIHRQDLPGRTAFAGDVMAPKQVPPRAYFLLGDNRDNSNDSRFSGPVQRDDIVGRVGAVYFSWDAENGILRWDRFGKVVQ